MNTNPKTVPERLFKKPMTWASFEQLEQMRDEMQQELGMVDARVRDKAAKRNGHTDINREITERLK